MKLPIDRFQLLGVGVAANNHNILTQLERKSEKCEYQGFSPDTLLKRKKILFENSSFLLDQTKRKEYEDAYVQTYDLETADDHQIIIEKGYEVAALLLLLESGEEEECIVLADRLYRERRMTMGYFTPENRELNRVIDFATIEFSRKLKEKRYYESAAEVLERRMQIHKCEMVDREIIEKFNLELIDLLPYRILDLLSRDDDKRNHESGIILLNKFVSERGGLNSSSDHLMTLKEFQAFFRQIRTYLTVQEQIELFEQWAQQGSDVARFLTSIALVAQGFSQRKPDRIRESLHYLTSICADELKPISANIHLLLGDVVKSIEIFTNCTDHQLREWAAQFTNEDLGQLCEWCREWLRRDVLKGYRDIDIDADLEAYFSDKDVIAYIENTDHSIIDNCMENGKSIWNRPSHSLRINTGDHQDKTETKATQTMILPLCDEQQRLNGTPFRVGQVALQALNDNLLIFIIILVASSSLLIFSRLDYGKVNQINQRPKTLTINNNENKSIDSTPNEIRRAISEWHAIKKKTLYENQLPKHAQKVASLPVIKDLVSDQRSNAKKRQKQLITVDIKKIDILSSTGTKAKVIAELRYSDQTLDQKNSIIKETKEHTFTRYYNLINNGDGWIVTH